MKIQKFLSNKITRASVAISMLLQPATALAVNVDLPDVDKQSDQTISELFGTIADVLIFIIGALSVIMLIVGGIRYVISAGDQNAVQGAKNTILYAIVGLVVALLASQAINFVLDQL